MPNRTAWLLARLWLIVFPISLTAAEPSKTSDPFALDGSRNILDEEHLGIVNGLLTTGIPYRSVCSLRGLWAPPFVSSDFGLNVTLLDQTVPTIRYTWHPTHVERSGLVGGVSFETNTMLVPGSRAALIEISLKNLTDEPRSVPLGISVAGSLDRAEWWEFAVTASKTPTSAKFDAGLLKLEQGNQAIVLIANPDAVWDAAKPAGRGMISLPASGTAKSYLVLTIGSIAEAEADCRKLAANPEKSVAEAQAAAQARIHEVFEKLPRLESSSSELVRFYNRSLVHFVTNRWDVPEFALRPNYTTGSMNGGCICNYLWDFGETWEIFPLFDPAASRTHIKQFVSVDMTKHFSFDPIGGKAFGPWYPANQEKIVGLIYYYVKHTGDTAFLNEMVDGKTIYEHVLANALYGDDPSRPVALIDYGPSNSHLELRRGIPYNHVMPDLNGRRYETYLLAAQLADIHGTPAPQLRQRAEELKEVLKRELWNPHTRWFDFRNAEGKKVSRLNIQVFKLLGSRVLDGEQQRDLIGHLNNEDEFLGEFGLHSIAKSDVAYDQIDIDNGGGGSYTGFPPQIIERLYKSGDPASAENLLKRILWWGDRVPYWGDSFVANKLEYRKDTPLQNTIGGTSGAQALIFGMFGIRAEFDGTISINPHPPKFAPRIALKGLRLRGQFLDVSVDGKEYEVSNGANRLSTTVGRPIQVRDKELLLGDIAAPK